MLESSELMAIWGGLSIHEISIESHLQCDIFADFCCRTGSLVGLGLAWESRSCQDSFWCLSKNSRGRTNNDHRRLLWWCLRGLHLEKTTLKPQNWLVVRRCFFLFQGWSNTSWMLVAKVTDVFGASAGEPENEGLRRLVSISTKGGSTKMFPKKDRNQQVLQEIFHLGRVSLEITPGFKWWQCFHPLVFREPRVLSSKIYTSHFFKWYWGRIDIMCMHVYIHSKFNDSSRYEMCSTGHGIHHILVESWMMFWFL